MRTSERVAVIAVAAMVLPAFLAFPVLGIVYVVRAWPHLGSLERTVFLLSVLTTIFAVVFVFRHRLDLFFRGETKRIAFHEQLLIVAPLATAGWALTHRWMVLVMFACWQLLSWQMKIADELKSKKTMPYVAKPDLSDVESRRMNPLRRWISLRLR